MESKSFCRKVNLGPLFRLEPKDSVLGKRPIAVDCLVPEWIRKGKDHSAGDQGRLSFPDSDHHLYHCVLCGEEEAGGKESEEGVHAEANKKVFR